MVWALSTGRSPRRIYRPSRRGRNHNINIWSKSHKQSIDLEVGDGGPSDMVLERVMGTDSLVLEFQASVNKPFISFPALWRVSAHIVLDFRSSSWEMSVHCPSHCLLIDNFTVARRSAFQRLCNPFPSPACPFLHLLCAFASCFYLLGVFHSH